MSSILQKILARSSQIRALDQRWTRISLAPRLPAFTHHSFVSRSTPIPGFYKHRSSPLKKKTPIDIVSFPSTGEVTSISSKVPLDRNGIKLHKFLKEMGLSGHRVFFKLSNGFITVEGSGWQAGDKVTRTCLLTAGDTVKAVMTEASEPVLFKKVDAEKKPKFPAVGILYKDQNLVAVFKPYGVPVHEGTRKHFDTLLTRLYENHGFEQGDLRPVHRLDKDTSGVSLLARNAETATRLCKMFADPVGKIDKKYVAMVHPKVDKDLLPVGESRTFIMGIFAREVKGREEMVMTKWDPNVTHTTCGKKIMKSVTEVIHLGSATMGSLLEFRPHTGRKHQIRVLAASVLRSPIVGDFKYGPGCPKKIRQNVSKPGALAMTLLLKKVRLRDYHGPGQDLTLQCSLPNPLRSFFMCTGLLQHYQAKTPVEDGGASSVVVEDPKTSSIPRIPEKHRFKTPKWKQQYNGS